MRVRLFWLFCNFIGWYPRYNWDGRIEMWVRIVPKYPDTPTVPNGER